MQNTAIINQPVRVRFAPSPTGTLHVGGARTALFNWLLARKTKGTFIIRVEDTDEARSTRKSEESILNDLKWMNLQWDEGPIVGGKCEPYRQSERKPIYKKYAEQLIEQGFAFRCFCTEEELDLKRQEAEAAGLDPKYDGTWRDADPKEVQRRLDNGEPYTIRFKVPSSKIVSFDDVVRGKVTWDAEAMLGDFIILRSNGMPVYNFCVAVDDATMGITHVIRAEEHLSNTLRQLLILEALNYKPPTYAHCSLILGSDRSKLSKRHGATSVTQFSEQGFLPDAMMNYLANLGWNDGTPKEIYTPNELIEAFDLTRIVKSSAVFDMNKLKWINGQHIRLMPIDLLQPLVIENLKKSNEEVSAILSNDFIVNDDNQLFINLATKIAQRDMELIAEGRKLVNNCLQYDINHTLTTDSHVIEVLNDDLLKIINVLIRDFSNNNLPTGIESNFHDLWKSYIKQIGKELGLKGKSLFHPIRFALTGRMSGPDIGDQLQLLALAPGRVLNTYVFSDLNQRINQLKSFSLEDSLKLANESIEKAKIESELLAKQLEESKEVVSQ
eukprot:CAMPEP_0196762374 /NCGR_PEP_ID=MMETSP1095-20130614/1794_1 /TAXON_ID=96789 ORGANISM="Chromulina nebulosa, Strain UTEXLB2642" /NCGR_SAMPLE_ID=MMETSP1095 /ASSEMBLY_ACC=CAM_ASM_000446 /LENGTH=554 /DNA_ID=CAMNT_0042113087 /DNA_START=110 /DNA_END=1774 /DNA_ORIENTATION=+